MKQVHFCVPVLACLVGTSPAPGQSPSLVQVQPGAVLLEKGPPIVSSAFSGDGKLLAASTLDSKLHVWETASGQKKVTIQLGRGPTTAIAFGPDSTEIVAAGFDKTLRIWNRATGAESTRLEGFKLAVLALAVSPDGKTLLAGTGQWNRVDPPEIRVYDLPQRKLLASLKVANDRNKGADVAGLAFAPDGKTFAAAIRGDGIQCWDLARREKITTYYEPFGMPLAATYCADGFNFAGGFSNGQISLLDARTWKKLGGMKSGQRDVVALSYSADGRTLASASRDGTVKLWDVSTLEVPEPITVRTGPSPASVALFSPQGKTLAVAGFDGKLQLQTITPNARPVAIEPKNPARIGPGMRLALVATDRGPVVQNLLALAEARVAGEVQLLERRSLDALLAEQKLSLSGFVQHEQIVQVGKLLGVDVFAVIEADARNQQAVGLVIFNAHTGVRLWDATLPAAAIEQTAVAVAQAVRGALSKQQTVGANLATICLTTVRNADLPRSQDALCDLVGQLLERGLVASPNLVLLERSRLDQVVSERNLPTESPLGRMLASLVRIELEVSKSPDGKGLRGTAFLVNNRGQDLGKAVAVVAEMDPAALAAALLQEVARPLKAKADPVLVDRIREVLRLNAEAFFFQLHKDWLRSLKARQAACALKPDDLLLRAELADALIEAGRAVHGLRSQFIVNLGAPSQESLQQSLDRVGRGLEALIEVEQREVDDAILPLSRAWYNLVTYLDAVNKLKLDETTQALLEKVQDGNLVLQEIRQRRALHQVSDRNSYLRYTTNLGDTAHRLSYEQRAGLTEEQLHRYQKNLLTLWLDLAEKWGQPPLPPAALRSTFALLRGLKSFDVMARSESYRQTLRKTRDPHVVLYDQEAETRQGIEKLSEKERRQRIQDFRLFVQKFLVANKAESSLLRYHAYLAAVDACHWWAIRTIPNNPSEQELLDLCRFMIEQNEVLPKLIQDTLSRAWEHSRVGDEARFALLNQLLPLVDSARFLAYEPILADPSAIERERRLLKAQLAERRQDIVAKYPDLDRPQVQPWPRLDALVDLVPVKPGIIGLFQPVIHDGHVYVVGLGQSKPGDSAERYLELMDYPLQGGAPKRLGKIAANMGASFLNSPPQYFLAHRKTLAVNACVHEGRFILGTLKEGVFVFSLEGTDVVHLHTGTGLPSNYVHQMECMNGKLYAGLGAPGKEAYLIAHDLKSGQTDVLASSRRKEGQSPLDNTAPWRVLACRADPERHRLLAYIWLGGSYDLRKYNGLWEIDARTGQLKLLHNLYVPGTSTVLDLEWASPIVDDKLVLALHDATYCVDLSTNMIDRRTVAHPAANRLNSFLEPRLADLIAFLQPGQQTLQLRTGDFFHKGWLYTSHPFGRIRLDGSRKESFPNLRSEFLPTFRPWECFAVAGGRIVIADQHAIWVAPTPP